MGAVRKRQSADQRMPVILRSFQEVIEEVGFENASVARVAEKAGVHPSLIIHYFGTKEKMVSALVDEALATYGRLIAELPRDGEPAIRLERLLGLIWSRKWHQAVSFPVIFSMLALSRRDDEVMGRVRHLYHNYRQYLAGQISFFVDEGVVTVEDERAAVQALISLSEGSHYFSSYHVADDGFDAHCQNMIEAARKILGTNRAGNNTRGETDA